MKLFCITMVCGALVLLGGPRAVPQQAVAPPPKPGDSGPTLPVTMKFIQDNLGQLTKFDVQTALPADTISNVVADPSGCMLRLTRVSVQKNFTIDYFPIWDRFTDQISLPLKDVSNLSVSAVANPETQTPFDLQLAIPRKTVQVHRENEMSKDGKKYKPSRGDTRDYFDISVLIHFPDEESANRLAKALNHAVELCSTNAAPSKKKLNDPF